MIFKKGFILLIFFLSSASSLSHESAEIPDYLIPVDPMYLGVGEEVPDYLIPTFPFYLDSDGAKYIDARMIPIYLLMGSNNENSNCEGE